MTDNEKIEATVSEITRLLEDYDDGLRDLNDTMTLLLEKRYIFSHIDNDDAAFMMAKLDRVMAIILINESNYIDPSGSVALMKETKFSWKKEE